MGSKTTTAMLPTLTLEEASSLPHKAVPCICKCCLLSFSISLVSLQDHLKSSLTRANADSALLNSELQELRAQHSSLEAEVRKLERQQQQDRHCCDELVADEQHAMQANTPQLCVWENTGVPCISILMQESHSQSL